jgi:hypothetical protein
MKKDPNISDELWKFAEQKKTKTALKDLHPICLGEGNYDLIVAEYERTEPKEIGNKRLCYIADAKNPGNYKLEWLNIGLTSEHNWN